MLPAQNPVLLRERSMLLAWMHWILDQGWEIARQQDRLGARNLSFG